MAFLAASRYRCFCPPTQLQHAASPAFTTTTCRSYPPPSMLLKYGWLASSHALPFPTNTYSVPSQPEDAHALVLGADLGDMELRKSTPLFGEEWAGCMPDAIWDGQAFKG